MITMRVFLLALAFSSAGFATADELRWSFDSLPADALVGDAAIEPMGPTGHDFQGMPESNRALRLDGAGDYVRVADNSDLGSLDFLQGDSISIESWVRLDRIGNGQNVYIVGKGRTHQNGARDNQNYALRLRGLGSDARLSFLFRSEASDSQTSDWHRWTSGRGFRADGSWHHVATTYTFGDPTSIRGYVDGKAVVGDWDMGGATKRPPVVDDDELWIGSSMGGSAGNSLAGAIDELVIARNVIPAETFADRRIVIVHPPEPPSDGLIAGAVNVAVYENVGSEGAWPSNLPQPLVSYQQSAFAICRIPVPYANGAVRRDWKGPVMLSAMAEVPLPTGKVEWMLRAGGLSRLWIGDAVVAETPVHLGASSGHGNVVRYQQDDPWLRPPRAGHFEELATHTHPASATSLVTLQTMIGGKSLRYEPGEIIVAFRTAESEPWQVLSLSESITVTDHDWKQYAVSHDALLQAVDDKQRRIAAAGEDDYWNARHQAARDYVQSLPPIDLAAAGQSDDAISVDDFIDQRLRLATGNGQVTPLTTDEQFLRRLYLDCVGVIPSATESSAFQSLSGDTLQRRGRLIDRVLADPRWADHWTAYWMDVLAENPNVLKPSLNNSGPFRWYLYDMLRDNVAVDRWVTGLLQMEGSTLGGGPAGFAMASDNDVPMAAKAHIVSSAFLGANMKCARCHDAPYHDWTQRDLFSLAAMLGREPIKVPSSSSVPKEFFGAEDPSESLISLSLSPADVKVCQHLSRVADRMDRITAVRTVHHDVINEHAAAVNRVHTGRPVSGTISYPSIGSVVSNQRGAAGSGVPAYVLIGYPNVTRGPGFLGAKDGYLYLTDTESGPAGLTRPGFVSSARASRRSDLLDVLRETVRRDDRLAQSASIQSYDEALLESRRLSGPEFMKVFDLNSEKDELRESYGEEFGQRCLLSRRLIERGVRFVEVAHNLNFINGTGWDTHNQGQLNQHILIEQLDRAMSALIDDLEARNMLEKTLLVVATEFGRPAGFDAGGGRGHQSTTFTMVLAGGGLNHRGAFGVTDELSKSILENPVGLPDFHATIYHALGIDPAEHLYDGDRPVPITDGGTPIRELFS
jgi:hypothetical protein